ncbi:alpha/beta hydrolase [Mycobacterium sp. CPCC 205372]|uniref:Alpha/beta hydrolase n=1 Tax=Mycobacterium hippophais TaxID=3016340 RepID=A0ABT4PR85_9MYCO|nr:alpha/beta hydrolase [Mycobacterium hippophais]MCZ8379070.1 alpha/beta hydrolase [Mycobacterium hippophais]
MGGVGCFRSDAAHAHFIDAYRRAQADLPSHDESIDVTTAFGTVRVYRFDGGGGRPVVLLPGRNASTPMWAANLPGLLAHRTVYGVDLLGEPGMSVQDRPLRGADDQARWFEDLLAGLELRSVHLMGVSFGGWTAANHAVRIPGRAASLTLLDPVMTFAPIPVRTMLAVAPMGLPGTPQFVRRRVLRWLSGGADVDERVPVAALISAGTTDFILRQPLPQRFTDDELRSLDIPVLALIAGRSVIHDARRAARRARDLLTRGQVELWPDASHAINGEFPDEIAARAGQFWDEVDGR